MKAQKDDQAGAYLVFPQFQLHLAYTEQLCQSPAGGCAAPSEEPRNLFS